jgi:FkbM family methyltransferase
MYRKVQNAGFELYVREGFRGDQDLTMFKDVIVDDQYGIKKYLVSKIKCDSVQTVVDCGGHIGSFGLLAMSQFPFLKTVVAVEPDRDSANLYQLNMEANGIKNVRVLDVGLSYNKNKNTIIFGDDCTGISMLVTEEEARKAIKGDYQGSWDLIKCFGKDCGRNRIYTIDDRNVKTITFEELLSTENLREIDILKMDCEGAECEVFFKL